MQHPLQQHFAHKISVLILDQSYSTREMGRRKKPTRLAHGHLIKTTRTVATILSKEFGIRSGYEAVGTSARLHKSKPDLVGDNDEANALKALFSQPTHIDHARRLRRMDLSGQEKGDIRIGDIVEITLSSTKTMLLIVSRSASLLKGAVLITSSETMLHDIGTANELFITTRSISFFASTITSKIDPNSIVLRLAWDETRPAFFGLNEWVIRCRKPQDQDSLVFHDGNFVMLAPRDGESLLDIVQVHRTRNTHVLVRRLYRLEGQGTSFMPDRLIVPAKDLERIDRDAFQPVASCCVSLLNDCSSSFTSEVADFFVTQDDAKLLLPGCTSCTLSHRAERRKRRGLEPLTAMEIMCGAGGLSLGLDLSGACETRYAMDADSDSTKTFAAHHPAAKVYCGDAGEALRRAMNGLRSQEGLRFPRPGEVSVIVTGPPCQGFSRKNRYANRDAAEKDLRNLLVCTVLGWVDYLRPDYFVLENVEGFKVGRTRARNGQAHHAMPDTDWIQCHMWLRSIWYFRLPTVEEEIPASGQQRWTDVAEVAAADARVPGKGSSKVLLAGWNGSDAHIRIHGKRCDPTCYHGGGRNQRSSSL